MMGDVGDYWREHKAHKKAVRRHWVECPHCAVSFGGNGTLTPPGCECRNCGWLAPGIKGSDKEQGERDLEFEWAQARGEEKRRNERAAHLKSIRTCPHCGKVLRTQKGKKQHIEMMHPEKGKASELVRTEMQARWQSIKHDRETVYS